MNDGNFINIRKLPPLTRLIYTIGELPTSYLMSMTYEEQLIWLCNYLAQTVIPTINNNADLVVELEDYIKNLDLDSEVRAVINEMVEDGTLEEILNQEVLGEINDKIDDLEDDIGDINTAISGLPTDESDIAALKKFNSYTNKPLKYGNLKYPDEFSHYNFNLFREYDGTISDDLDVSKYDSTHIIYVDRDNGSDSTGTGAEDHPYQTIKGALTSITNSSTYDSYKIICKTYRFYRNEFINESAADQLYAMYKNIIIEPDDLTKQIVVGTDQTNLSWTSDGNGVYHTTRSQVTGVFDLSEKDTMGMYKFIPKLDTLLECQNTVNSYYISGSTVYIHTKTGSAPTLSTYMVRLGLPTGSFNIRNNLFLRLRNFDFYPSTYISFENSTSNWNNTLILENVNIFKANTGNGFNIDNIKNVYVMNCNTAYNLRDGFNYHYTSMPSTEVAKTIIYEKNCRSYNNGYNDTNTNNNCSTVHEGCNIVRVNGVYQTSTGPVIADVGSSHTLMENCGVNQELQNHYSFNFQNDEGVTTGKAYLVDCKSLEKQTRSLTGTDDFKIRLINFKGNYENSDLDIALWSE